VPAPAVRRFHNVNRVNQIRHAVDNGPFVEHDGWISVDTILIGLGQTDRGVLGRRHVSTIKLPNPLKRLNLRGFRVRWEAFG
jgi:hypothetical protein